MHCIYDGFMLFQSKRKHVRHKRSLSSTDDVMTFSSDALSDKDTLVEEEESDVGSVCGTLLF